MLNFFKSKPAREIAPAEADRRARAGEILLVDVREPNEWAAMHVAGAISAPLSTLATHLERLPSDKPVVFYCLGGKRSAAAIEQSRKLGFAHDTHVTGGITAWRQAGLPVVSK